MPVHKNNDHSIVKVEKLDSVVTPVPQNRHQTISALAHTFWEKRGRPQNDEWADWLAAEAHAQENGSG